RTVAIEAGRGNPQALVDTAKLAHELPKAVDFALSGHGQHMESSVRLVRLRRPNLPCRRRLGWQGDSDDLAPVAESQDEDAVRLLAALFLHPERRRRVPATQQKAREPHFGILRIEDELRIRCRVRLPAGVQPVEVESGA